VASIERTAYPRFKSPLTSQELVDLYTPTPEDLAFAQRQTPTPARQFFVLVLLKAFQRLGYFPKLADIPPTILTHLRGCLHLHGTESEQELAPRTLNRYRNAIRTSLRVTVYAYAARHLAVRAVYDAAQTMDNPADLINVALETLIKERYELPAFRTLDRLVRRVRTVVNYRFFVSVFQRLSGTDQKRLDALLVSDPRLRRSPYNRLKQVPKRPTLTHLQEWLDHLTWLLSLGAVDPLLDGLPPLKRKHFALEAKALDAAEMKDFTAPKRYALLLCLIQRMRTQTRDQLGEMFIKRMHTFRQHAKDELARLRTQHQEKTVQLLSLLAEVVTVCEQPAADEDVGRQIKGLVSTQGTPAQLREECEAIAAYNSDNYHPLVWRYYRSHRRTLFRLLQALTFTSTTQDQLLMLALDVLRAQEERRGEWIAEPVDLGFASERWQRTVSRLPEGTPQLNRRHFEVCVFWHLAEELKSGDMCIEGSETYADYREQLLPWRECEPLVANYCQELELPTTAEAFVHQLRTWLDDTARQVDSRYPANSHLTIDANGKPSLKRPPTPAPRPSAKLLEAAVLSHMPERNLLDVLANVNYYTSWTRHFGPLSGSDPKLEHATERYLLTTFAHGCNLGPTQAARHMRGAVSAHTLSFVNRRHVNTPKLHAASRDIINLYARFPLPKLWGSGKTAAADGTKYELYDQNLLAEYHVRYGSYGGIAYHHIADTYIALFSHFIPCGVWEAVYIIEGLLQNTSDIQPDTVHADTQGQSTPVFGLAHLLGIKLMPRIRNWHDLVLYRPDPTTTYPHIDALFTEVIDWELIKTHWQDLLQVLLSIKAGKISSALLLRKLGNYSRKNRLYQAFRELGRVVRTVFLLDYLANPHLRHQITDKTNRVEAYNGFAKWLFFGGEGIIAENDPEEQEKMIKYNDLVANAVIFQNVVDQSRILTELVTEGFPVHRDDVATLSPYPTSHLKRFGDYVVDVETTPQPLTDIELAFNL
jgi:TnpA family transposase